MRENILLIGMPGAGKSTLGVILAKTLGYKFLDTDILFCEMNGTTLQHFIDGHGIDAFLKAEEAVALSVDCKRTVIATGGSMVLSDQAMQHLKDGALTIFLNISLDEMKKRLSNIKTRGIVLSPGETIDELFRQRLPLYTKYADTLVPKDAVSAFGMEEMLDAVLAAVSEHKTIR
jgi:shikimate kinase